MLLAGSLVKSTLRYRSWPLQRLTCRFRLIKKRNISDCILFCGILVYLSLNHAVGKHNPCKTRNLQLSLVSQLQTPDRSKN